MTRFTRKQTLTGIALVSMLTTTGILSPRVHATSSDSRVWVVEDVTTQSQCTSGLSATDKEGHTTILRSGPCPAETITHFALVSLATAQAEHQPYVPANADQAQLLQLAHTSRTAPQLSRVTPESGCNPLATYDATTDYKPYFGGKVHLDQAYHLDIPCANKFPATFTLSQVSGSARKRDRVAIFYQGGAPLEYDNDTPNQCYNLPHSSGFNYMSQPVGYVLTSEVQVAPTTSCDVNKVDSAGVNW